MKKAMKMKHCFKQAFLGLLLIGLTWSASAQDKEAVLFVKNKKAESNTLTIKWLVPDIFLDEGVNLYRQEGESTEWTLVNESPIVRVAPEDLYTTEEMEAEETLAVGIGITDDKKAKELEGMEKFVLLNAVFQSEKLSKMLGIQYDDPQVENGKTYTYKLERVRGKKQLAVSEPVTVGTYQPAVAIEGIELIPEDTLVKINWMHEEERYWGVNIFRKAQGEPEVRANKAVLFPQRLPNPETGKEEYPNPLYVDDAGVELGVTYEYRLVGYDYFGDPTEYSEPIQVTTVDMTPPAKPVDLALQQYKEEVEVRWRMDSLAEDMAGYHIFRSRTREGQYDKVTEEPVPTGTLTYRDTPGDFGDYYYAVAAVDRAGNANLSFPAYLKVKDVTPPEVPQNFTIQADTGKFILSWTQNTEPDFVGYRVYRQLNKDEPNGYLLMGANLVTEDRLEIEMPENVGNVFYYKIAAVDTAGNISERTEGLPARLPDVTPPPAPFLTKGTYNQDTKITTLNWMPTSVFDLAEYKIFRATWKKGETPTEARQIATVTKSETTFEDKDLQAGFVYAYQMVSVDEAGNSSEFSNKVEVLLPKSTEVATPQNITATFSAEEKAVALRFEAEKTETTKGFTVYRSEDGFRFAPVSGLLSELSFQDKRVKEGKTYFYQVRAYDESGAIAKSESISINIK